MSDERLFAALDVLIGWPKWLQRVLGLLLGAAIATGAWVGHGWGVLAITALGALLLVTIRVGDAAIKEAEERTP